LKPGGAVRQGNCHLRAAISGQFGIPGDDIHYRQCQGAGLDTEISQIGEGFGHRIARQGPWVRIKANGAGLLAEGGESHVSHQLGQIVVVFSIGVGKQHRGLTQFRAQPLLGVMNVLANACPPLLPGFATAVADEMIVVAGVVGETGTMLLHLTHLLPVHEGWKFAIHRVSGGEYCEWPVSSPQPRVGLCVHRQVGVIDGDGDTAIR